jgi:hypothetical protein
MNSNSSSNTSFTSAKSETVKSIESKKSNHLTINDFESFDSLRIAFQNAKTRDEQIQFSYVIPLGYDETTQSYKLQPNSERIFNYLVAEMNKPKKLMSFDLTKSQLYQKRFANKTVFLTPLHNPDTYTTSPFVN